NVGTATIAAFIGAGGFGERIAQGLALNDHTVLLAGALPAAALALAVHAAFELAERCLARRPRKNSAPLSLGQAFMRVGVRGEVRAAQTRVAATPEPVKQRAAQNEVRS